MSIESSRRKKHGRISKKNKRSKSTFTRKSEQEYQTEIDELKQQLVDVQRDNEDAVRTLKDCIEGMTAENTTLQAVNERNEQNQEWLEGRLAEMDRLRKLKKWTEKDREIERLQNVLNDKIFEISKMKGQGIAHRAAIKELEGLTEGHTDLMMSFRTKTLELNRRNHEIRRKFESAVRQNRAMKGKLDKIEIHWKLRYRTQTECLQQKQNLIDGYELRAQMFNAMMRGVDAEIGEETAEILETLN